MLWAEHVARNTARERDDVCAEVKPHFSDAELVELTGVCGFFAMLNRFQDSLHLPIEEPGYINNIRRSVRADPEKIKAHIERLVEHWPKSFPLAPANAAHTADSDARRDYFYPSRPEYDQCRVALLDPNTPEDTVKSSLLATQQLLGGVSNAARAWAHIPYAGMLSLPFHFVQEHEGTGCILPSRVKAIVFLRTSHLNSALYTLAHNIAFARAVGLSEGEIHAARTGTGTSSAQFSSRERAALLWAENVAPNTARRNAPVFDEVKRHFNHAELVELTALCATMNMANRMHNALRIPLEPQREIDALNRVRVAPAQLKAYLVTLLHHWPRTLPLPQETA